MNQKRKTPGSLARLSGAESGKIASSKSIADQLPAFQRLKNWLCRMICGDRLFNRDMSLEIDRLTVLVEAEAERRLNQLLLEWGLADD